MKFASVAFVVLSVALRGLQSTTTAHYTILTRAGSEADVAFATRWLNAAEQLMATKYHVVPDGYHMSVNLLARPENGIDTTQSGQNRCCVTDSQGRKAGTIFLLGPSAPIWKERRLESSLGLPKDGEDYHAKVLMSEYIPVGHAAAQDSRPVGGWSYYSAPQWFVQGLQEYDAIYHTTETNRTQTAAALMTWARQNAGTFVCCAHGIELGDVYNGGAAFMAFLAAEFGEGVHERILRNGAATFDEALARETRPRAPRELVGRFRDWLALFADGAAAQGARLRPGESVQRRLVAFDFGQPVDLADHHVAGDDARRGDSRHGRLHEPGAGARKGGRRARRHLRRSRGRCRSSGLPFDHMVEQSMQVAPGRGR